MSFPESAGLVAGLVLIVGLTACKEEKPASSRPAEGKSVKTATPKPRVTFKTVKTDPARRGEPGDWCGGHDLPESMCTKCNPHLKKKFQEARDWCDSHGYPKSACPECNPWQPPAKRAQKVAAVGDWCAGHALPESMCTQCNPELKEKFQASGDWCTAHELPESACPKCNPWQPPRMSR